ncbi:switch-associated protein 70-like [Mercenaria mercenaria]|uniref:switch-associated protein 70-like n=1 Tax=Mercenaria mercenaria TaxID=6596 RepID=UPI00234F9C40|nr:switch-associated protein 70-like [Mercenaria mercenaria]XP_053375262.1 switch-associated protein 70-like [Mercenaria mercenaria]XP_053375263.1 switch-associated protein 70-like [Mercenaria mercenaria]
MSIFRGSLRKSGGSGHGPEGELQTNSDETMDDFQRETMKSLWHAFDMLDTMNTGTVHVSQLKVITSTIGSKMGFDKAEEILNKDGVLDMDFQTYFDIVKTQLITKQECPDTSDETVLGARINTIVKTCWTFCNFERKHHCKSCTSEHCIVLWRLYNFLSETDGEGEPAIPVHLDPEEAALLLREFIDVTGQRSKESQIKQFLTEHQDIPLTFTEFLNVFEKDYVVGLSNRNITQGLNHLYDTYILNILMKGKIKKRGFKVKSWKDRWLVLTPTKLNYFVGPDEKVQKGTIQFDSDCSVEVPPDRPAHKPNRFVIQTPKKPYEMSAHDLKSKNEWVSAVQQALSRVGIDPNIQKEDARERCKARAERRRQAADEERKRREEAELLKNREDELDEEKRRRLQDGELLRARLNELEEERKRREEAEARWQEEQTLREAEQQRLRELEEIKRELERLLAEERQAKKDEEIVRNLQSKLLEEEFEKREELERLKQQQEEMLRAEREQKAVLESDRKEQERLFAEAQARLEQLERDKAAAAEKMQEAAEKLQKAEKDRYIMEEKVKLWKTPVGLARPIQPHPEPLVTHRGLGAFCDRDFVKKQDDNANREDENNGMDKTGIDGSSSDVKDDTGKNNMDLISNGNNSGEKLNDSDNVEMKSGQESDEEKSLKSNLVQNQEDEYHKDQTEVDDSDENTGKESDKEEAPEPGNEFESKTINNEEEVIDSNTETKEITENVEVLESEPEIADESVDKNSVSNEDQRDSSGKITEADTAEEESIKTEQAGNIQDDKGKPIMEIEQLDGCQEDNDKLIVATEQSSHIQDDKDKLTVETEQSGDTKEDTDKLNVETEHSLENKSSADNDESITPNGTIVQNEA